MSPSTAAAAPAPAPAESRSVTVAAVPAGHPYVQRVSAARGIALLDDPSPAGAAPGVWWPPVMLDPEWITRNRDRADILHIHFGTESFPPGHLTACLAAAGRAGWPTVFTVHDLVNPQLRDQDAYSAQLDELIAGADAVTTLTPGAAAVVRDRWGREAAVIPHTSLLGSDVQAPPVRGSDQVRIGVHLKDLRPSVDAPGTVAALIAGVEGLRAKGVPAVAEVRMHHRVRDESSREQVRRLCADAAHATLIEHERLSDPELIVALSRLDACVLPYRHGTHSGWLELCWDLGVPVAAPRIGFFAEQHPDDSVAGFDPADAASLAEALGTLLTAPPATRSGSPERASLVSARQGRRRRTDALAADAHAELYRRLVAERAR